MLSGSPCIKMLKTSTSLRIDTCELWPQPKGATVEMFSKLTDQRLSVFWTVVSA